MVNLSLTLADKQGLAWSQATVEHYHYLHHKVDIRCSLLAYIVQDAFYRPLGCLIFGRPEAQRCNGWYGSVEDVSAGRCRVTRWQVLNLARVWLHPDVQRGGSCFVENAATWAIGQALHRVAYDYLVAHPPCFLGEPWLIRECLSYCDTRIHQGTLYRASNFALVRENTQGIQTYMRPLRGLTTTEQRTIARLATDSPRSKRYRAMRLAERFEQLPLMEGQL